MFRSLIRSLILTVALAVILCGVYPLAVTVLGQLVFSDQASGGLITKNGRVVGAKLIGQNFTSPSTFMVGFPPRETGTMPPILPEATWAPRARSFMNGCSVTPIKS